MKPKRLPRKALLIGLLLLLLISVPAVAYFRAFPETDSDPPEKAVPEISFSYWDIDQMQNSKKTDGLTRYLENRFGFRASARSFNWSNYRQQYQILTVTDELPDVFTTVLLSSSDTQDSALLRRMIDQDSIQPLPDDLSDYPYLEALIQKFPELCQADGHYYAIPHPFFDESILSTSDSAMLVRRDWMDALGIDDPQTPEEFLEMTAAFANKDPDGNGKDDTIGYTVNTLSALGKWVMLGIAPECNAYSWVKDTDGVYRPSWCTDAFRDVVVFYRKLYESGGLDPKFYAKNSAAVSDDFCSGRLGAFEYKSSASSIQEIESLWNERNDLPFSECVDVLPIFPAPDGTRHSNSSSSFWSETYLSSQLTGEELDIVLDLLNYLLSPEGDTLCSYGLEGVDYEYDESRFPVSLDPDAGCQKELLMKKYPSWKLWANIGAPTWSRHDFEDTAESRFLYGENSVRLAQKALEFCENDTVPLERPYDFLRLPKEDASFNSQAFQSFIECILGTEDPLKMWDAALNRLYDQGLKNYIMRQNPGGSAYENGFSS